METPSENDQAAEDQNAGEDVTTEAVPEKPADRNLGDELIAGMEEIRDNPEDLKNIEVTAEEATVSDAIDDARPDDDVPDHDPEDLAGDAMAAKAEDAEVSTDGVEVREYVGFPQYQCHKTVEAFKIANMEAMSNGNIRLIGAGGTHSVVVDSVYVDKHRPQAGGYYVQYHDGYRSWSPADAFEQGYTLFGG